MAANRRSEAQREHDLAIIAELYLQGKRQWEIAAHLDLSQPQIAYDLAEIKRRWRESALTDFHERQMQEVAAANEVEREAWQAWFASKEPRRTATSDGTRTTVTVEERSGDAEHLRVVLRCISLRCELLGLYATTTTKLVITREESPMWAESELDVTERARRLNGILELAERERRPQ